MDASRRRTYEISTQHATRRGAGRKQAIFLLIKLGLLRYQVRAIPILPYRRIRIGVSFGHKRGSAALLPWPRRINAGDGHAGGTRGWFHPLHVAAMPCAEQERAVYRWRHAIAFAGCSERNSALISLEESCIEPFSGGA